MNYRKLIEIMVGSMQIEVSHLQIAQGTWDAFIFRQIEAWTNVIVARERISAHEAMTQMFEAFEDISVETPVTASDHLTNAFYGRLGRMLNRL